MPVLPVLAFMACSRVNLIFELGYSVARLAEVLFYKVECRGLNSGWGVFEIFHRFDSSRHAVVLKWTQPVTETSSRDFRGEG
jgi:hypothetical protein